MIARLDHLRKHPAVFRHLTGITVEVFDALAAEVVPAVEAAHRKALDRPDRQRAIGGGDDFDLPLVDHVLATIVWLRQYPTQEVLGFLFGVSDSTAKRAVDRCLPVLEKAGKDTMRMPDPGRGRRKKLPTLLNDTPGLAVVIDSFEQRTQRPKRRQRAYYSGKKKAHTLKTQVAVDEESGRIVDVSDAVPGRWADIKLLEKSRLLAAAGGRWRDRGPGVRRDRCVAPGGVGRESASQAAREGASAGGPALQPRVQPPPDHRGARDRPAEAVRGGEPGEPART